MSIQVLRDGTIARRRTDRQSAVQRRMSRLLALNAVTSALTQHVGLPHSPHPDDDAILDLFDIDKGRHFDDSLYPTSLEAVRTTVLRLWKPAAPAQEEQVVFKVPAPVKEAQAPADAPPAAPADASDAPPHPNITPSVPDNAATPKLQRMQTRVSSGAMRQKSVSEIMHQTPKATPKKAKPLPSRTPSVPAVAVAGSEAVELSLVLPTGGYTALIGAAEDPNKDYLEPLYRIQAQDPPNGRSLAELLHKASKAVTTADQLVSYRERQDHRILKRIYGMQYSNNWSLRQMLPCPEPLPVKTHWDYLLDEVKWMRIDFRQERKEKKSLARFYAEQCAQWVAADANTRLQMQVLIRAPINAPQSPATVPDLEKDYESSVDHDIPLTPQYATVPGSVFSSINVTDSTAHLLESDEFCKALNELPTYQLFRCDSLEPKPLISKYSTGKILAKPVDRSLKRSRYDYDDEPEDGSEQKRPLLSPEQSDVALFDPEHKHIKDRLRAGNMFRPPSEFPMPAEKFYEWRLSSQWTWEDDQKLRKLAKDYCFNWSLIANQMALPSHFHGAADRRTPWECFERWVELEALPTDMRKTVYFRTWHQRLETASRAVEARYQAQLQAHSQTPTSAQPPIKRRMMPTRVERRRTGRYLHAIDAMRKLARKREQQQHKQAEAHKAASMRKQQEPAIQSKATIHTPQEFSRLRYERDLQMQARNEKMREQMMAQQQKVAQMQRMGGNQHAPTGQPQQQRQPHPQQNPNPSQSRQTGNVVPQAQMRPNNQPAPNQLSQEAMQRMAIQQAQLKNGQHNQQMKQFPNQIGPLNNGHQQQGAMMFGNSPMPPPINQPKQLSSGHVPAINQIKHTLQAQNPQATPQQIDQMANEQMKRQIQAAQARQNAINAASGNYQQTVYQQQQQQVQQQQQAAQQQQVQQQVANGVHQSSPQQQQYSQLMRQRLMAQQQQMASQQNPSPRLQQASPVNMHISPVMQQAVVMNGQQRPPSRNTTPHQMARIPSNNSIVSPGMPQGSPRPQMVKQ